MRIKSRTVSAADMSSHSWERPAHAWDRDFEADVDDVNFWGECSDDDYTGEEAQTPGDKLVSLILDKTLRGKLSSKECCELMFWADKAGVREAKPFALPTSAPNGHASRKLKTVLGHHVSCPDLYAADLPGHSKHDVERSAQSTHFLPLHEQITNTWDAEAGCLTKLLELKAAGDVPASYTRHKVVLDHPSEPVVPLAIFLDGVPYSHTDSVLGCWGLNVITGTRFLWGVIRKRNLCKCGCAGWCTYFAMFQILHWSLAALAEKRWPLMRHDGTAWADGDDHRSSQSGKLLMVRMACIFLKGDWAEYAHTFGLSAWNDTLRSCFCCNGSGADMYVASGNDRDGLRWRVNLPDDYETACRLCEVLVRVLSDEVRDHLATILVWDKKAKGGRCVARDVPALGLKAFDRLEPSQSLPDVGLFEEIATPCNVKFWRRTEDTTSKHRNPLFDASIGVTTAQITCDTLHCFYLGVMLAWCRIAVWALLSLGVYGSKDVSGAALQNNVLVMRGRLMAWYKARKSEHPSENLTQVNDWTPAMVGSSAKPKCKTKGAETWGLLLFLLEEIRTYSRFITGWQRLEKSGSCLESLVLLWRGCTWKLSDQQVEDSNETNTLTHSGV